RRAENNTTGTRLQKDLNGLPVADSAAYLVGDAGGLEGAQLLFDAAAARLRPVQVHDVDDAFAEGVPPGLRLGDGVFGKDGLLIVVALNQVDAESAANIDRGNNPHQEAASMEAFTVSTILLKAASSWTAKSASTLRSRSMLAIFRPLMKRL